jgi:UDP:flavonoid glycosyltransferase YjiC (YdhE family)
MPRIDFAAVLPHVVVAIHHGGAGTTHALVTHGVPQMVVPHAGDQGFQARAVARVAVGVHCPAREMNVDKTERILASLLPDRSPFRTNAANLQQEFAALGGVATSAALIEGVSRKS